MQESGLGEYVDLLRWAAYGEASGEALFAAMAELVDDPDQREALQLLATLEQTVAIRLRPLVTAFGEPSGLTDAQVRARKELAHELTEAGWMPFLSTFANETRRALDRYARLRELAPQPEPSELALLTEHEEALVEFARLELKGDHDAACEVIRAVIERAAAGAGSAAEWRRSQP